MFRCNSYPEGYHISPSKHLSEGIDREMQRTVVCAGRLRCKFLMTNQVFDMVLLRRFSENGPQMQQSKSDPKEPPSIQLRARLRKSALTTA
jgi:hypothetical protein